MTDTTKAAVEAAWRNYCEAGIASGVGGDGETDLYDIEDMNEAAHEIAEIARKLVAERDAALAGAVRVKPLIWEYFDAWTHWARIERGSYYVEERNGRWRLGWCVNGQAFPLMHTDDTMPEDLETAKAAAQSDYDARIRAALEPDPERLSAVRAMIESARRDALEEAAKVAEIFVFSVIDHPRLSGLRADEVAAAIRALADNVGQNEPN